jgi:DNA-binding transcriptional LysR family regulator
MQLDIESLRTFLAVLDQGGMSKAGVELGMSQSAVSWKIKRLEERVGRDLLIREGRSLRPSFYGRELLSYARRLVATHDEAVARLGSSEVTGNVKVGAAEEVGAAGLVAVLGRFNRVHPGATVEFVVGPDGQLDSMLAKNELDVAVLQVDSSALRSSDTVLWTNQLVWVTSRVWTYDDGVVPLIAYSDSGFYRPMAERILREGGTEYRLAFSGSSTANVLAAVEAGLGVALINSRSAVGEVMEWPRAETLPDAPDTYQVARTAPGPPSAITSELLAEITAELTEV